MKPPGETETDPVPVPANVTVRIAAPLFEPVKQTTFAVIFDVTRAPDDVRLPALELVVTVAETRDVPQLFPTAVNKPVGLTMTIWGSLDPQTTSFVMSFVTGGWT